MALQALQEHRDRAAELARPVIKALLVLQALQARLALQGMLAPLVLRVLRVPQDPQVLPALRQQ